MMANPAESGERRDFFISYTGVDEKWATWIAGQLEADGYTTFVQAWDFSAGQNFIRQMHQASTRSDRVLAVVSAAYLTDSTYGPMEWMAALVRDGRRNDRLLPVLVEPVPLPGLLAPIIAINLWSADGEDTARRELLDGVRGARRPDQAPPFPGSSSSAPAPDAPPPVFPGAADRASRPPQSLRSTPPTGIPEEGWSGGLEVSIGGDTYLIHDPVAERTAPDRSVTRQEAKAQQLRPAQRTVLLKRVRQLRDTPAARAWRQALLGEQRLLNDLDGVDGMPRFVSVYPQSEQVVLAQTFPPGRPLRQVYGPTDGRPLDAFRIPVFVGSLRTLSAILKELHKRGRAHRALIPDGIYLPGDGRRSGVRDLGLATTRTQPGEGPAIYRAPEQERPMGNGGLPGPRTDVYQLAAVVYHVITGQAPSGPMARPPASAWNPELSAALDTVLTRALEPDVRKRSLDIMRFWFSLRDAVSRPRRSAGDGP